MPKQRSLRDWLLALGCIVVAALLLTPSAPALAEEEQEEVIVEPPLPPLEVDWAPKFMIAPDVPGPKSDGATAEQAKESAEVGRAFVAYRQTRLRLAAAHKGHRIAVPDEKMVLKRVGNAFVFLTESDSSRVGVHLKLRALLSTVLAGRGVEQSAYVVVHSVEPKFAYDMTSKREELPKDISKLLP